MKIIEDLLCGLKQISKEIDKMKMLIYIHIGLVIIKGVKVQT